MQNHKFLISKAIDDAGSVAELVRRINIQVDLINLNLPAEIQIKHTYPSKVNNWVNRDVGVAPNYVYAFSQATGISCNDLRPDVFIEAANDPSNQQDLA